MYLLDKKIVFLFFLILGQLTTAADEITESNSSLALNELYASQNPKIDIKMLLPERNLTADELFVLTRLNVKLTLYAQSRINFSSVFGDITFLDRDCRDDFFQDGLTEYTEFVNNKLRITTFEDDKFDRMLNKHEHAIHDCQFAMFKRILFNFLEQKAEAAIVSPVINQVIFNFLHELLYATHRPDDISSLAKYNLVKMAELITFLNKHAKKNDTSCAFNSLLEQETRSNILTFSCKIFNTFINSNLEEQIRKMLPSAIMSLITSFKLLPNYDHPSLSVNYRNGIKKETCDEINALVIKEYSLFKSVSFTDNE